MSSWQRFTILSILLLPASADACWFDWLFRGANSSSPPSYYSPASLSYPQSFTYTVPPVHFVPQPRAAAPIWATPTPAPPSSGPLAPRGAAPEPGPAKAAGVAPPPLTPSAPPGLAPSAPLAPPIAPMPAPPSKPNVSPPPTGDPAPPPPGKPLFPELPSVPPPENKVIPPSKPAGVPEPEPPPVSPPGIPGVQESRSYYDAYPVMARNAAAEERCTVCFWNLSNREVQATVAGQTRTIARGKKWTLQLPRTFRWQLVGQELHQEQVGERESGLEIVIRK